MQVGLRFTSPERTPPVLYSVEFLATRHGPLIPSQLEAASPQTRLEDLAKLSYAYSLFLVRASTDTKEVCKPCLTIGKSLNKAMR